MITWIRPSGLEIETGEGEDMELYAVSQGWKLKDIEKPASSGEVDFDEPQHGTSHKLLLDAMESKEEISEYLKSAGVECDMRGSLRKVKEKALAAIEG
jgi:hypothetical protein